MPPLIDADAQTEQDQIRIPIGGAPPNDYLDYPLANLIYDTGGTLRSTSNFGLPPIRFITQRGPFQDGETPLDMRVDPRVLQIEIVDWLCDRAGFWTRRNELLDLLRPNRAFSATGDYRPLIYRKFLPGGKVERGSDGIGDGTATFSAPWGRFVHYGGLRGGILGGPPTGDRITINGVDYGIQTVVNDYTLILDAVVGVGVNLPWRYVRGRARRDLEVLLEQGPTFNEQIGAYRHPAGYREALRFVAHDPIWRGETQAQRWALAGALSDLIFDYPMQPLAQAGAWFGATSGTGRWLFSTSYIGQTARLVYWGTFAARPTIIIEGPATNPAIENSTVGVRLEMAYSIAAGETVTIDTLLLTCTNNFGANLLPYLTGDLATFAIEGAPQGATLAGYPVGRVNNVTVNFSDATPASSASLTWQNRYIGI